MTSGFHSLFCTNNEFIAFVFQSFAHLCIVGLSGLVFVGEGPEWEQEVGQEQSCHMQMTL
jgi:hypothetical protein